MRTITPELTAILRSRFQAAGDGFSGRIEIDSLLGPTSAEPIDLEALLEIGGSYWFDGNFHTWTPVLANHSAVFGFSEPVTFGSLHIYWHYGGAFDPSGEPSVVSGAAGPIEIAGGPTFTGPWTVVLTDPDPVGAAGASYPGDFDLPYVLDEPATYRYWRVTSTDVHSNNDIYEIVAMTPESDGEIVATTYRPKRINLNRNLRMGPDQASIDLVNEGLPYGWGPTSIFPTNSRIRCYQWFGDVANEVLTFTGVIDKITDSRDVLTTSLECRSMAGPILVDQTFSTTAPQLAGESGTVRTEDNGVYLSKEVDYIAGDILERAGWPSDDIDIADSSFVLDEFVIEDGATWWDTLARLAGFVGYELWDDEDAVIHLKPLGSAAGVDDDLTADYEYEIGIA